MDFQHIIGHEDIIRHFKSSIEMDRVGHAYIICGEDESGRSSLAFSFVSLTPLTTEYSKLKRLPVCS